VPTLLASNLVSSLQRNTSVAFTAEVGDEGSVQGACAQVVIAEGVAAAEGRDLVGFAGHGWLFGFRLMGERVYFIIF
jgi:hypothetical protein